MVDGVPSEKVSTLSFVDLAGTDRRHAKVSYSSSVRCVANTVSTVHSKKFWLTMNLSKF